MFGMGLRKENQVNRCEVGQEAGWEPGGRVQFQLGRETIANDYQTQYSLQRSGFRGSPGEAGNPFPGNCRSGQCDNIVGGPHGMNQNSPQNVFQAKETEQE